MVLSLVVLLLLPAGCKKNLPAESGLNATGTLVSFNGCKDFGGSSLSKSAILSDDPSYECLDYEYDGSTLRFTHINAAFNCCLERIIIIVRIEENRITLE